MKNLLVAQSGGPTVAINSTLMGIYDFARKKVNKIYGARFGIKGILDENIYDLSKIIDQNKISLLAQTPACALGSCRQKLKDPDESSEQYENLIKIFRKYSINYFIYIGGNDSMDTVSKISNYLKISGIDDIIIVGAPKTIDNDLFETDHCPGFGSAAKYIATTLSELERDCSIYPIPAVTLVEIMGRDAGWLTAASALSRLNGASGPSLIYCCEKVFDIQSFFNDIDEKFKQKHSNVLIALSEGICDKNGKYISEIGSQDYVDEFGHKQNAGAAKILDGFVKKEFGCKVRSIEINTLQRCAAHIASQTDIKESIKIGEKAAECVLNDMCGEMSTIVRKSSDPYQVEYKSAQANLVANKTKRLPDGMISKSGNDVTIEAIKYLKPLIQGELQIQYKNGIPVHADLFQT